MAYFRYRGSTQKSRRLFWDPRGLIINGFVLLLLALVATGCKEKIKGGKVDVERPVITGITLSVVEKSSIEDYYETSATVRAKNVANVSTRMMGEVTSLNVREGDFVRQGQVLLTVDDRDIEERIKAAESGYKEALKGLEAARQNRSLVDITYQRHKKLHDEKAISQQELDQIETQKKVSEIEYERAEEMVNRAKAGLSEVKVYQGYTRIKAPFSGIVTEKKIERGNMAVPGAPLLTIEDSSSYRVEANIDERFSGLLKKGMPVDIRIESVGLDTKGTVSEVIPTIDPMTRTFLIKIDLKASGLRSGLYANIRIPVGKKEAILVPQKAVVEKGQLTGVYVADDEGIVTFRPVKTGKRYGEAIVVLSGLNSKERIVTDGIERVIDGGVIR
jgi:RND family efflux transporter MFP subunit